MISIIVSSYKPALFNSFSISVKDTIGDLIFEIVQINNPGLMGVCEAYNQGAAQAKYPYLIFCHEDIIFHTKNWGEKLLKAFESDSTIGLLGVLGSKYKSSILSGWAIDFGTSAQMIHNADGKTFYSRTINNKHILIDLKQVDITEAYNNVPDEVCNDEVVAIDGMFMATTKEVYKTLKYDQETFKHFHCYDIDYSLQVLQQHKVVVNHNILIEHLSSGNFDKKWFASTLLLHNKWKQKLPAYKMTLNKNDVFLAESKAFDNLTPYLRRNKADIVKYLKYFYSNNYIALFGIKNWFNFQLKILRKSLKL
jgi:glycosyltransferase involved in cell wall biosynthesis